ncbi:hypothetical protein [[Eubacterium] cellulosolvens]
MKVLIVGDPGSGKQDVARGADVCVPFKTLGVSIGKKCSLNKKINYKLTLIFWTLTYGRPLETTYFHGAGAAIIVGNLNSRQSITRMRQWGSTIKDSIGNIPIFFIGTKDGPGEKKNLEKLKKISDDYNSRYFILSREQEGGLKIILKSIAKHLGNTYYKLRDYDQVDT